ncbi:endonuclease/exonuclease/phosphatase family protein [Sunxiuqinia sp. sy24]|uniref:endonuclease/exonuclease/phosphatase family protein n=1 Tax=Sunxiuqinia sp. sy24 TaxID=3461495 RepID=UPI00404560CA
MKNFFRNSILFFNLIAILGLLMSYLAVNISPANWWVPAFFGLAFPYFLFLNILFVLLWLFSKTRFAILSVLAITLGYTHLTHYIQLTGKQTTEEGLVVCSYNVKNFYGDMHSKKSDVAENVLKHLQAQKADIICLQEFRPSGQNSFTKKPSKGKLPDPKDLKYAHASKSGSQVNYSRFPIIHKEEVHFEGSANMILISDLKTADDTLRLFNCHLESYRFTDAEINSLDSISFKKQEESYRKVRYTGSKLKKAFIKRTEQAETLHQLITDSPHEVIVCGDFNDTPISYTYATVAQGLDDAFVSSGVGIANTYLGKLPSFRIDYILHSSSYESYNFKVDKVDYSDHYPISCTLIKKNQ